MEATLLQTIAPLYEWFVAIMMPWGIVALFGLAFLESLYLIGLITPGEVVVVAAALVAAGGAAPLWLVLLVACAGNILGVTVAYWAGRALGIEGVRSLMFRWNNLMGETSLLRYARVDCDLVDDVAEYFAKHGALTAFGSRFAYGAKSFVPPVAGATRMPFMLYITLSAIGSILYNSALVLVGWVLQRNAALAAEIMQGIGWLAGAAFLFLFVFAFFTVRRFALRRREKFLEERGIPHEEPLFIEREKRAHEFDD